MDLSAVGFTVKIGNDERRIPANDMAIIDFTGGVTPQSDWDRLSSGQFAVLKDGQIVIGQLTDVGGSSPLRLSFSVNGANRDIQSNAVARIVLARPNDAPATPAPSNPSTGGSTSPQGLSVSAQQAWTPTGIIVSRGETLTISATGDINFGAGTSSSNGSSERSTANPVPAYGTGALVARIGNGKPFAIGSQMQFQAPAAGQLFLGINDTHVQDNSGAFEVQIQRGAVRTRR
jgi:hypothetical protein